MRRFFYHSPIMLATILLAAILGSSCIFSPDTGKKEEKPAGQWVEPTTPRKVIANLVASFDLLNIEFFDRSLHANYYYRSPSNVDELDIYWSKSEDRQAVESLMDKSEEIIFTPSEINVYEEYGKNVTPRPDGANLDTNEEHPDDIWYICEYYITIDIFSKDLGEFKVQQDMKFKMVEDKTTHLYSIIRWVDENPLTE